MMSFKKLTGVVLVVVGVGFLAHWAGRSFFHPTTADRQYLDRAAEFGGGTAMNGKPPASIFLILGVGAIGLGARQFKQ